MPQSVPCLLYTSISSLKEKLKDLDTADQNVDFILQMQIPEPVRSKTKDLER